MKRYDPRTHWFDAIRLVALGAVVLDAAGCDSADPPLERPDVPVELAVSEDHPLSLIAHAVGVQVYECVESGGALAWKLRAPRADLLDAEGRHLGIHFGGVDRDGYAPGPYWESDDGSWVHADTTMVVSAPNPGSIPLLRLATKDTAAVDGTFARVAFIQRLETTGGVAPTGVCAAGERSEVEYTASYYFYDVP